MAALKPSRGLTREHVRLIGEITAEAAFLETVADLGLWGLMGISRETGRVLATSVRGAARLGLIRRYAEKRGVDAAALAAFEDLASEIRVTLATRNGIVHTRWHVAENEPGAGFVSIGRPGGVRPDILDTPLAELRGVADALRRLAGRLIEWLDRYAPFPAAE